MVKFLGDIALTLELLVIAGGLIALHFSRKEDKTTLLKTASYALIVGGLILGLCTSIFHMKFFFQGDYESALTSDSKPFHRMHHQGNRRGGQKLFRNFHNRKFFNKQDQNEEEQFDNEKEKPDGESKK